MAITNGYCTLAEFKADFYAATDTTRDAVIEDCIEAASRGIDNFCYRYFYKLSETASAKYFTASEPCRCHILDAVSITSIEIDTTGSGTYDVTLSATNDYWALGNDDNGTPYTWLEIRPQGGYGFPRFRNGVKATAVWGWAAAPDTIKRACLIQSNHLFQLRDAPHGVSVPNEYGQQYVMSALLPDVKHLLMPYRKGISR